MTRVIGPTGSRRRRRFLFGVLLVVATVALSLAGSARAVHDDGLFELDKNALNNVAFPGPPPSPTAGDDWDTIYNAVQANPTAANPCSALANEEACAWLNDPADATIFTGGSSKDDIDINAGTPPNLTVEWQHKSGSVPPKDEITNGYSAMYKSPTDQHKILYVGADRFANNGSSDFGAWFFQSSVSTNSNGTFNGQHVPGDILLLGTFTQGGATATIRVFKWVGEGGTCPTGIPFATANNTVCGPIGTFGDCVPGSSNDQGCGTVNLAYDPNNSNLSTSPWPYTPKFPDSGQPASGSFPGGSFFEGGIDLTALNLEGCFSSFLIETRSSPSVDATLKDFVLGKFEVCAPTLSTTPSATVASPVAPGSPVHDTLTLTITGAPNPPAPTGTVSFFYCGPIASGTCSSGGTAIGAGTALSGSGNVYTSQSPDINTVASPLTPGRYCFRAEWPGDNTYKPTPPATKFTESGTGDGECFKVKDTSSIVTAQKWLPQDTATVTTAGGTAVTGTVEFKLYESADCSGSAVQTFSDSTSPFETNNLSYYTTSKTISWSATFTPSNPDEVVGSTTTRCEKSVLTITNDSGPFPPVGP